MRRDIADPAVSIAMTSYNGARFLQAQLDSLAAQTLLPAELVVCDDGSTDATLEILERFAAVAPFAVRIRRNASRLGYRANFIQAASLCQHEMVAFCDQDDTWHPEKLQRVLAQFAIDPDVLLVYHNGMLTSAEGAAIRPFYDEPPQESVAPHLTLPPWHFGYGYALAFRRVLLAAAPLWPRVRDTYHAGQPAGHDVFFFTVAASLGSVAYCHECLVQYRQHAGQTIGTAGRDAPGWLQRWRYRLEDRHRTYLHLATVAAEYAALFEAWPDFPRDRAAEAAASWHFLARLYGTRAEVARGTLYRRLRAWLRLRAAGAYGDGYWTFGEQARWKDAVLGVALAPAVARFGRIASEGDGTCRRGSKKASASF